MSGDRPVGPAGQAPIGVPASPAPAGSVAGSVSAPPTVAPGTRTGAWHRGPRWAWLAVVCGTVIVLLTAGVLVVLPAAVNHYAGKITRQGGLGDAAATGNSIDGPINVLLVGTDERADDPTNGVRADSIIVAHVTASHDAVYLASIPRDSLVEIPAFDDTDYPGGTDKINAAFQYGFRNGGGRAKGMELLADTVSQLSGGMKFDGAVIINFDGLRSLIRAVGGVRMCVDEKVTSIHVGWDTRTGKPGVPYDINSDGTVGDLKSHMRPQVYYPGCHQFADWQALDYARQRDLLANHDADYGRQRHQQQLIKAIMQKTTSSGVLTNPVTVTKVLDSIGDAITFYNNGVSIADWVFTLKGVKPDDLTMLKTNGGKFNSETVDGIWYEMLSDTSLELFGAMADDTVESFVADNPTWVTPAT